jgi:hypothetical protein
MKLLQLLKLKPAQCNVLIRQETLPTKGTLQQLVQLLLQEYLSTYSIIFINTILDLVSVEQLLFTMTDRLVLFISQIEGDKTIRLQIHRLISVLIKLIKRYPTQFQDEKVIQLIQSLLHLCEPFFGAAYCEKVLESLSDTEMLLEPFSVHKDTISIDYLLEITSQDIDVLAMQMTVIDSYYFEAIQTTEWLDLKKDSFESPRLVRTTSMWNMSTCSVHSTSTAVWECSAMDKLTERFNVVGHWVASLVCSSKSVKLAAITIEKMIELAHELFLLNNFHSSLAIVTGLANPDVLRLKQSWKRVSKRHCSKLKKLEVFFDSCKNFDTYRKKLQTVSKAIPLIMLVCKDIYQVKAFQPKYIDDRLNFERSKSLYQILSPIQRFQEHRYTSKDVRISDPRSSNTADLFLQVFHMHVLEANELHRKSAFIE